MRKTKTTQAGFLFRISNFRISNFFSPVVLACIFLLTYWLLAVSGVWHKSATFDELPHLTGGCSYWLTNDYRLVPECGNFPQRWAALPLLFARPNFPTAQQTAWHASDVWTLGRQFFFECGNNVESMLLPGRMMIALLGVALGLLVYLWSRELFGPVGGIISLVVCCFCPTMLAHGALTTSDMAVALFVTASTWSLWRMLHRVTPLTFLATGLAMSGLFLSKMSAVVIVPVGLVLLAIRIAGGEPLTVVIGRTSFAVRARWMQFAIFSLLAWLLILTVALAIWTAFGWRYEAFARNESGHDAMYLEQWSTSNLAAGLVGKAIGLVREHRLLPEAYIYGFAFIGRTSQSRAAFLNGEFSQTGFTYFFPYCLLVKTPPWLFLLLGVALIAAIKRCSPSRDEQRRQVAKALYQTAPLWTLFIVYWLFALGSNLNIGQRYLLPIYPVLFVLAGAAGMPARSAGAAFSSLALLASRGIVGLALAGLIIETLLTWPHFLAYFNVAAGGSRHGCRHLVDSSLDWGQDLPGLRSWLDAQRLHEPVYLSYFGTADPAYYGVRARPLPSFMQPWTPSLPQPLRGGTYCISATMLQGVYLPLHGQWNDQIESDYRLLDKWINDYRRHEAEPDRLAELLRQTTLPSWQHIFLRFEEARFGRLCEYLRQREPDLNIGYSILIYKLTNADVEQACGPGIPACHGRLECLPHRRRE